MLANLRGAASALFLITSVAHAAEPAPNPVPVAVTALRGCWRGNGTVMGKRVAITIAARPIVQNALFLVEAESNTTNDPKDRYSAHLIFGNADKRPGASADQVFGFWADSFGGAFTVSGLGRSRSDGFDVTYRYPDDAFVNRWRLALDRLKWEIIARDKTGKEEPFASYFLERTTCPIASK